LTVTSSDLELTKVIDDPAPDEGQTVFYTVTVTNQGPDNASGVLVNDALPAGVTHVDAVASQGTYDDGSGDWDIGGLAATDVVTLTIEATVDEGTAGDLISNLATVIASDQEDPDGDNNSDTADCTVGSTDLQLVKSVDPALATKATR
ncbi:MAG: DUF11 domain-containing protein, partial [bacterium]